MAAGSSPSQAPETRPGPHLAVVRLRLVVKDNGVGLPPGLDVRGTRSLGLQLVMTLVDQLDAALAVASQGGPCFELNFAVENCS
ncbi:MAG: hypothetical protein E6J90_02035 [Deltaproteobacteria bacterium]|nr:MAG: hypothetical protein E6J90_02035 [Deltaproteobacteria bacterium]